MAEVLGIIASGISIAQLTGQVANSLVKLKGYWDQVKDAPEEISSLMQDLELLNLVFSDLEQDDVQSHVRIESLGFCQALHLCRESARELKQIADALSHQLLSASKSRRTRAAVKVVLKRDQIKRYKASLKRAISLLQLSHQCYTRSIIQLQSKTLATILSRTPVIAGDIHQIETITPITPDSRSGSDEISASLSIDNLSSRLRIDSPSVVFDSPLLGYILLSKHQQRKHKTRGRTITGDTGSQIIACYRAPIWLSYRAWEICCSRAQAGWTCHLTTYNVIPNTSRQFRYARAGSLSKIQQMISSSRASIFDQTASGDTMLSIAAENGHIHICRWLLDLGAHTNHSRFGSILQQLLYYGGWISFQKGVSMFEIVKLLQTNSTYDVFDYTDNNEAPCSFYGRKEVFDWLIKQSSSLGKGHSAEEHALLAINIARNIQHNGPELVKTALAKIDPQLAFRIKDSAGVTLLHRISSRLAGSFAYEVQRIETTTIFFDEGFSAPDDPYDKDLLARNGWSEFFCQSDLEGVDLHSISYLKYTPLMFGFRTLVRLWVGQPSRLIQALKAFISLWLSSLTNLGIDILKYGEEEKRLQRCDLTCTEFYRRKRGRESNLIDYAYGCLRLVSFEPHSSSDRWQLWWSEPTDEFCGDFWRMCEQKQQKIPGSWDEDTDSR